MLETRSWQENFFISVYSSTLLHLIERFTARLYCQRLDSLLSVPEGYRFTVNWRVSEQQKGDVNCCVCQVGCEIKPVDMLFIPGSEMLCPKIGYGKYAV